MTWLRRNLVLILGLVVLAYTFVPIAIVILMSFNAPKSRLVYRFDGVHPAQLAEPLRGPEHVLGRRPLGRDRAAGHRRGHHPRHADGVRPGPARVRRPLDDEPAHLPADGHARDRDGLLAPRAVRGVRLRRQPRLLHDPDRPHHVLHLVRGGHRESPAGGHERHARTGSRGPLRHAVSRRSGRSPSRSSSPASWARRCSPSRCRSTTSSSPTSTRAPRRRSRSTSGVSRSAGCRCRST